MTDRMRSGFGAALPKRKRTLRGDFDFPYKQGAQGSTVPLTRV
jgi:hypothetical protein